MGEMTGFVSLFAHGLSFASRGRQPRAQDVATVCALLDAPDPRAMRLVPIVVSLGASWRATGLADGDRPIGEAELKILIADQHALAVETPVPEGLTAPLCAAWLGRTFFNACEDADAPDPPFDRRAMTRLNKAGWFAIDRPAAVFAALDAWYRAAFLAAIERRSRAIAELLSWVDPNRDHTRAALYLTGNEAERERELAWWARLERDASGRDAPSREQLIERIDAACASVFLDWAPPPTELPTIDRWGQLGIATRCAERLARAVDPYPNDPAKSSVAGAIQIARDAALRARPADRDDVERTRIALIEQVHHPWQNARISAHLHPSALHAVESALFFAERINEPGYGDQAMLALTQGLAEVAYPEINWMPLPTLWQHFAARGERVIRDDATWLARSSRGEGVSAAFFERSLWPTDPPVSWEDHLVRFHARLFPQSQPTDHGATSQTEL
jgi:hypothetical protein